MDKTESRSNQVSYKDKEEITENKTREKFDTDKGPNIAEAIEFISSCNSLSELIDKLSIENIRLWHILDDTVSLKKELERTDITETERVMILEKIAKKSFENIETVKRRSIFKKAIDEIFSLNVKNIVDGKNVNICNENKSYGR